MKHLLIFMLTLIVAAMLSGCAAGSQSSGAYDNGSDNTPQVCWRCGGNGVCNNCHGTGRATFVDDYDGACGGSGRCPACNGRGN